MSNEIDATTTFYALTAPQNGYTLEDQVLGPLTLREWLHVHSGGLEDAAQEWADDLVFDPQFYLTADEALGELSINASSYPVAARPEPFTPEELLNRLRLDAMDCD
jgi:hypothetical protein